MKERSPKSSQIRRPDRIPSKTILFTAVITFSALMLSVSCSETASSRPANFSTPNDSDDVIAAFKKYWSAAKVDRVEKDMIASTPASFYHQTQSPDLPSKVEDNNGQGNPSRARSTVPLDNGQANEWHERQVLKNFPQATVALSLPDDRRLVVYVKGAEARVRAPLTTTLPGNKEIEFDFFFAKENGTWRIFYVGGAHGDETFAE
jgi:hypothetical protein